MKIVFMGTPDFAVPTLDALSRSEFQVACAVTQPDRPKGRGQAVRFPPVKQFALERGIPVLQPEKVNTPDFIEALRELAPDLVVVVAFGQILSSKALAVPRHFCLNLHASLLPKYRGAAPINRAIINGERETGVATMKMDAGMDTGDILLTRAVPIKDSDNAQTLHDTLAAAGADLVLETVRRLERGALSPTPQDHSQATYAAKLKKEDGLICWNKSAVQIRNLVRGLEPWPGAYVFYKSRRIRVCETETAPGAPGDEPGTVVRVSDYGIEVGTGHGRAVVTRLQPESKKPMSAKSFLQGHPICKGDRFESSANQPAPI